MSSKAHMIKFQSIPDGIYLPFVVGDNVEQGRIYCRVDRNRSIELCLSGGIATFTPLGNMSITATILFGPTYRFLPKTQITLVS